MSRILRNKEFQKTFSGDVMIHGESGSHIMTENDREFICAFYALISGLWPESVECLSRKFAKLRYNVRLYEFRIVRQWIKCNLGNYDGILDIDQLGNLHLEIVSCPLRGGDCPLEGIVCKPKFNSKLSERELEIMRLYFTGHNEESIADSLCISQDTIRTHKRNVF